MNKREWLASQGLAEIGKRGRFSREAEAAWANHMGPDPQEVPAGDAGTTEPEIELPRDGFHLATLPPVYEVVRKENSAYTIDDRGRMIGHSNCGDCKRQIRHCECSDGPWGLSYIKPRQKAYVVSE
jgi:hypothetical protein